MGGPEPLGPGRRARDGRRHPETGAAKHRTLRAVGANPRAVTPRSSAHGAVDNETLLALTGIPPATRQSVAKTTQVPGKRAVAGPDEQIRAKLQKQVHARTGESLTTLPGVQSLSLATRYLPGGRSHLIELVQYAALNGAPDAIVFLAVIASLLPYERQRVSYDDVCAAAGIPPSRFVGVIASAAMEYGADVGNLVYAASHPKVVAAGVAAAMKTGGTKDREMLFQHQGFIPVPRSTVVTVNASASADARAAAASQSSPSVPSFAEDLASLGAGVRAPAALPPAVDVEPVEFTEVAEPVGVDRAG